MKTHNRYYSFLMCDPIGSINIGSRPKSHFDPTSHKWPLARHYDYPSYDFDPCINLKTGLSNICSQQIDINLICISYTYSSHEYQSNFILILIHCYSHNNNRLGTFRIINNIIQGHYI